MRLALTLSLIAVLFTLLATPAFADEPTNKFCPVMEGEPVDAEIFVDYKGRRVWFCCDSCVEDFNADPEKYLARLDADDSVPGANEAKAAAGDGEEEDEDHALGALHPVLVHFPVALTMAGLLAMLLSVVSRQRFAGIAFYCVLLGAVLSVPTFLVGEDAEEGLGRLSEARHEMVEAHELWGTISMYVLLGTAVIHLIARLMPDSGKLWLFSLLVLLGAAAVVGYTGYLGGEVARPGHFQALFGG
jgi:uncharacterized membrane protein/YHS domain-containing protein